MDASKITERAEEASDEQKLSNKIKSILRWFAQPSLIFAITSAVLYALILLYYICYFDRLSLPYATINFSSSFYLFTLGSFLIIGVILAFPIYLIISPFIFSNRLHWQKNYLGKIGVICLGVANLVYFLDSRVHLDLVQIFIVIIFIFIIIIFIYNIIRNVIDFEQKTQATSGATLMLIPIQFITVILFLYILINQLASNASIQLINGQDGYEIEFVPQNNSAEFSNKTFMLVTHSDNKYYVVDKDPYARSGEPPVKLYEIRGDQVKSATIKKVSMPLSFGLLK